MKPLLVLLTVCTTLATAQGWEWQNPLPQGNPLNSVYFTNTSLGWAVGGGGTILHTSDGGATWAPQASGTISWLRAVHFFNDQFGWAVGNGGTILHTTDGGNLWTIQAADTNYDLRSVCFINADSGWAVGINYDIYYGVVLRTTNGGNEWLATTGPGESLWSVYFIDASNGWVSGALSTAGQHRREGNPERPGPSIGDRTSGGAALLARTTDGGLSWTQVLMDYSLFYYWSVRFLNDDLGWVVGSAGRILRTTNGGSVWSAVSSGTTTDLYAVRFTDPEVGFVVGYDGTILHSSDGGVSWTAQPSGSSDALYSLSSPTEHDVWVAGNYGTIIHTTNGGNNWILRSNTVTSNLLNSVSFSDSRLGWAVGSDGVILHTTDTGETWDVQVTGTSSDLNSVHFVDSTNGWAVGDDGTVLKTVDGGEVWTPVEIYPSNDLSSVHFIDRNSGWMVSDQGVIFHSSDGGVVWATQLYGGYGLGSVYFVDDSTGWAVGGFGKLHHTTNGGNTWITQTIGYGSWTSVYFTDINRGWIVGDLGEIRHTTNGGISWIIQTGAGPHTRLNAVRFSDPNRGWAVGGSYYYEGSVGEVLYTTNGGTTWAMQATGTANELYDAWFSDANIGWTVGRGGTILHTTTGGTLFDPPLPPDPILPINGSAVSTNVALMWESSPLALWYSLQVSTTPSFVTYVINQTDLTSPFFQVNELHIGSTYYWRVNQTDTTGTSNWSETWSFIVTGVPNPVVLLAPDSGAVLEADSARLVWRSGSPDVDRYWLEGATDSLFSAPLGDSLLIDTSYTVNPLHSGRFWWRVKAHNTLGWGEFSEVWTFSVVMTEVIEDESIPGEFSLSQNYPNPFNPTTTIHYGIIKSGHVTLRIYNTLGQLVRTLVDDYQSEGYHEAVWSGKSESGYEVSSGIYIYRMRAGDFVATRRMLFLK